MKQSYIRLSRITSLFNPKLHTKDVGTVTKITDSNIRFSEVTLQGQHREKILQDVSCTFKANTINALIGVSGSGKSSLTALILRLIDHPDVGDIHIGEYPITAYKLESLRKSIAYVPQEAVLFNQSISDVISFGNPNIPQSEIRQAAKLADADTFIKHHPGGYNFKVGDQGNLLSGGQRQRLLLARAYVREAKIMILDEVFASQDPATRKHIMKNLRMYAEGRTVILITNILDVLDESDNIVLMDEGTVVKSGSYKELEHDPVLRDLIAKEEKKGGE
jgi:ABC-type bacteriocin/lantibiotic exporter with double-glycine peptidase domain